MNYPLQVARYRSLDIWRGVACICVVIFHTVLVWQLSATKSDLIGAKFLNFCTKLNIGVPVFFAISGYCIAALAHTAQKVQMPVKAYFWRRIKRIFPPYLAAIALQCLVLLIIDCWLSEGLLSNSAKRILRPWTFDFWPWVGNLTLTESWRSHLIGPRTAYILGQSWTLCYEEQFYLLIGILLLFFPKSPRAALCCFTIILSITLLLPKKYALSGLFIDGRLLIFALGIYLYVIIHFGNRLLLLLSSLILILAFIFPLIPSNFGLRPVIVFTILMYILHPFDQQFYTSRLLVPLRFCGKICYSLYLTHPPFVRSISQYFYSLGYKNEYFTLFIVIPLSLLTSIIVAWIFYELVESKFINCHPSQNT